MTMPIQTNAVASRQQTARTFASAKRIALLAPLVFLTLFTLSGSRARAQDKDDMKAMEKDTSQASPEMIGYFLGLSIGQGYAQSGIELADLDEKAVMAGFKDGISKQDSKLSDQQLEQTQQTLNALLQQRRTAIIQAMKAEGEDFLASNKDKDGVVTLDSGLQYKVLEKGKGQSPAATDTVKVHYTGKLISGRTFDSSVDRGQPATFRVGQVIPGWQEGLQKMKVGSKWMLYVPSELAYGERGSAGAIGPHQVLVFEVELLEIL